MNPSVVNKQFYINSTIYDTIINSDYNLISDDTFSSGIYLYMPDYINTIQIDNKLININIKNIIKKKLLYSFGITFNIKNLLEFNKSYNCILQFNGRVLSSHTNLKFKIYTGYTWEILDNKIINTFQSYTLTTKFIFNQGVPKYRIGIINLDLDIELDLDNNINDYIVELSDIKIINQDKYLIRNNNLTNELNLTIHLYNNSLINNYKHFQNTFIKIKKYLPPSKIKLKEYSQNNNINNNDILWVDDIREPNKKEAISVFSKFKKKNIIWYNFETPYHPSHYWAIKTGFINNYGLIVGSFLNINNTLDNKLCNYWIPSRSLCMIFLEKNSDSKYNFLINDTNYISKYITIDPITHSGVETNHTYNKFGRRGNIIKTLLKNKLNLDIYGTHLIEELKEYKEIYKGTIGERYDCNYGISKIDKLSEYKFILVFENLFIDGYLSERLCDVLCSCRIPIYFGYKNIKMILPELFNNGVINGFDFDNLTDLIEFLKNMTNEEYNKRIENIKRERGKIFKICSIQNQFSYILTIFLNYRGFNIPFNEDTIELRDINNKLNLKET